MTNSDRLIEDAVKFGRPVSAVWCVEDEGGKLQVGGRVFHAEKCVEAEMLTRMISSSVVRIRSICDELGDPMMADELLSDPGIGVGEIVDGDLPA